MGYKNYLPIYITIRSIREERFLKLMHSPASRKQLKLIVNNKIFAQMKDIINEKVKEFAGTGKKIPVSEISKIIAYKDRTRIRNTIKALIGNNIYDLVFGGHKPAYEALAIEQIDKLVKEVGVSKNGIEGLITERGIQMLKDALARNIPLSKAKFEIWCQVKEHKPFYVWWGNLKKGQYCRRCDADSRTFSYWDVVKKGLENGFYLQETPETIKQKILKERGNKSPSQVALEWVCEYGHLTSKCYADIHRSGCIQCYHEGRSITYSQAQDVASLKGYTLDMTPAQFKRAKDNGRKKNVKPSLVRLRWSCSKHSWWTSYQTMKGTGTCPICSGGYYEFRTRKIFYKLFGVDFFKIRLIKLFPRRYGFHGLSHFDGYAELNIGGRKVRIAFEFQGYQHYKFPNIFHRSYRDYLRNRELDAKKREDSMKEGIVLVVVPYIFYYISHSTSVIIEHIIKEVTRQIRVIFNDPSFVFQPGSYGTWSNTLDNYLGDQ